MKIKKIAVATLVPAAIAGVTVSSWAAVQAATSQPDAIAAVHHARAVHPVHRAVPHQAGQGKAGHATHGSSHKKVSKAQAAESLNQAGHAAKAKAHHRAHAKAAATPAAPAQPVSLTSGMSSFEQCVAWRESGDNPTASSAGLFGILPSTWASLGFPGTAGTSSVALQKAAFDKLYAQDGTSPWAPYDGC